MSYIKVAVLGPRGTNSEEIAQKDWGDSAKFIYCETFGEIFDHVVQQDATYGVIPIEDSVEGDVAGVMDLLSDRKVYIVRKACLTVKHYLLAKEGIESLRKIGSHPQVLAQCKEYLDKSFPNLERIAFTSTARAALEASKDSSLAAIANNRCAKLYGLRILQSEIMTNYTQFFHFALEPNNKFTGPAETSVVVYPKNDAPGILAKLLDVFVKNGVNLTKIYSRPVRGSVWKKKFFISFEGSKFESRIANALKSIETLSIVDKVWSFGSYPFMESETGSIVTGEVKPPSHARYSCALKWFGRNYIYAESFRNSEGQEYMVFKRPRFKLGSLPLGEETMILPSDYVEIKDNICRPIFDIMQAE